MRKVAMLMIAVLVLGCAVSYAAEPEKAKKEHGYLGVGTSDVPQPLAVQLGLEKGEGLLVVTVENDSPAAKAGIVENDIITKVGDQIILTQGQFRKLIGYTKPGTEVKLKLIRKAKRQTVTVKLGGTDRAPVVERPRFEWFTGPRSGWWGPKDLPKVPELDIRHNGNGFILAIRGPDGKMRTLTFEAEGWEKLEQKLKDLLDKGTISLQMLEMIKRGMPFQRPVPEAKQLVEKKLNTMTVSFDFRKTPLGDVLEFVGQISKLNLVIDPELRKRGMHDLEITLKLKDVTLKTALELICGQTDMKFAVRDDGVIAIGTPDYIRRLIKQPPDKLPEQDEEDKFEWHEEDEE